MSCEQTQSPENELIPSSETECKSNIHFCKLMRGTRGTRDSRAESVTHRNVGLILNQQLRAANVTQ